jgi:EAL domain-containing protein (putative c-di-GMP-specific phosphodiesterase class I)
MAHLQPDYAKVPRRSGETFPEFQIMLQPIVDLERASVFAYEALCCGLRGESYSELVGQMDPASVHPFDELILVKALRLAAELRLEEATGAKIALNVGPTAGLDPRYVRRVAKRCGIKPSSVVIEFTEGLRMDTVRLARIIEDHRAAGVVVALDDFGAGYAGLSVLAACTPDVLKIDSELIRNIDSSPLKKTIVGAFADVCRRLRVGIVAEGVETLAECSTLQRLGISLMQGYFFARPRAWKMPRVSFPRPHEPDLSKQTLQKWPRISKAHREWLRRALRE